MADRAKRSRVGALARDMRIVVEDALSAIPKVPFADHGIDLVCASVRRTLERHAPPEWHSNVRTRVLGDGVVLVSFDVPRDLWDRMVRAQRLGFRARDLERLDLHRFYAEPIPGLPGFAFEPPPLGRDRGDLFREGSASHAGLSMVVDALAGAKRFRDEGRRALSIWAAERVAVSLERKIASLTSNARGRRRRARLLWAALFGDALKEGA